VCIDSDSDGVCDPLDNCPLIFNNIQADADGDGVGDVCDACTDIDRDGFGNPEFLDNICPNDNCPFAANPTQTDSDDDGLGDICDICTGSDCPVFVCNDVDDDFICDVFDNCPVVANQNQADGDGDGVGNVCDICTDIDRDGFGDPGFTDNTCPLDNCSFMPNPDQTDSDDDGIGDDCERPLLDYDDDDDDEIRDWDRMRNGVGFVPIVVPPPPPIDPCLTPDAINFPHCNPAISATPSMPTVADLVSPAPSSNAEGQIAPIESVDPSEGGLEIPSGCSSNSSPPLWWLLFFILLLRLRRANRACNSAKLKW
jgi:hypothetical protein